MTMTVSTMQLGVCTAYAGMLWFIGSNPIKLCGLQWPESQPLPATTSADIVKTLPVGFCAAAAHSSSVFALGGDPLFGQIVKAGEPVRTPANGVSLFAQACTGSVGHRQHAFLRQTPYGRQSLLSPGHCRRRKSFCRTSVGSPTL